MLGIQISLFMAMIAFWSGIACAAVGNVDSSVAEPDETVSEQIRQFSDETERERAEEFAPLLHRSSSESIEAITQVERAPAIIGPATEEPSQRLELYQGAIETNEHAPETPEAP